MLDSASMSVSDDIKCLRSSDGIPLIVRETRELAAKSGRELRQRNIYKARVLYGLQHIGQLLHEIKHPRSSFEQFPKTSLLVYEFDQCSSDVQIDYGAHSLSWDKVNLKAGNQCVCTKCFIDGCIVQVTECEIHKSKRVSSVVVSNKSNDPPLKRRKAWQGRPKCKCGKSVPYFALPGETRGIWCAACKPPEAIDVKSKRCVCGSVRPSFASEAKTKPMWCKKCKEPNAIDVVSKKKCMCGKTIPHFAFKGQTIALWCNSCKQPNAVNIKTKLCVCGKAQPTFALEGQTKPQWCKLCKPQNAISVRGSKCLCGSAQPSFALEGQTKPIWCRLCREANAVDVITRKCVCGKSQPSFAPVGQKKAIWCADCKQSNAVDVWGKKCECGTSLPSFALAGQKKPVWCSKCKRPGAINVKTKKCFCGARFVPLYGYPNLPAVACVECKKENMIFQPRKKCMLDKCNELAIYGHHEKARCEKHKLEDDQNFIERVCVSCGLLNVLDSNDKCAYCDPVRFQEVKLRKEHQVVQFLLANGIVLVNDKIPNTAACGKERPDIVIQCATHVIIVEVDENQHCGKPCDCEQTRMINITQTFGGTPCFWIRFNPDSFKMKTLGKQDVTMNRRLDKLLAYILGTFNRSMQFLAEVLYMYFDDCHPQTFLSEVMVLPQL